MCAGNKQALRATFDSRNTVPANGVAWLRTSLTLLILGGAAWGFIQSTRVMGKGDVAGLCGYIGIWIVDVPLLIAGILSLLIAVALFRKSVRGVKAALIFDILIGGSVALGVVVSSTDFFLHGHFGAGDMPWRLGTTAVAAGVVLLMGAEAAWLQSACRGWRGAWRGYAVLAVLMAAMVVWLPLAEYRGIQHARVLREYIGKHLITVPADARITVLRDSSARFSSASGGHEDRIDFDTQRIGFPGPAYGWVFTAQHDAAGWRFENVAGVAIHHGMPPVIQSAAEARDYLIWIGVPASQLGTDQPMAKKYSIARPDIGGRYEVGENGGAVLYLVAPLVIPDR